MYFQNDWLIRLELLELAKQSEQKNGLISSLNSDLKNLMHKSEEYKSLIESGLNLLHKKNDAIT